MRQAFLSRPGEKAHIHHALVMMTEEGGARPRKAKCSRVIGHGNALGRNSRSMPMAGATPGCMVVKKLWWWVVGGSDVRVRVCGCEWPNACLSQTATRAKLDFTPFYFCSVLRFAEVSILCPSALSYSFQVSPTSCWHHFPFHSKVAINTLSGVDHVKVTHSSVTSCVLWIIDRQGLSI